ncbi:ParA family protein [Hirschia maritima]|uniref:ParA family protein n=1 Tax=Hirschia maritima TaxID=1121961 RepID=UPI0003814481|nr:ParA family protein [Hirschia maritima]
MRIVSVMNMKGGVGKSTSVCMLAEALASQASMRVLVVDLDPQSNASMILCGLDKWSELRESERTLDSYFAQFVHGSEPRRFHEFIAPRVSDIQGEPVVDLVVATPEFRYVERDALDKFIRQGFTIAAVQERLTRLMASAVESVASNYDVVLFDCPPGISLFAEAAITMSEYVVIPTIPDYVSRLGIFAFRRRAVRSMEKRRFTEDNILTLITKYDPNIVLHESEVQSLRSDFKTFDVVIPQNENIARAGEWAETPRSFDQKYGDAAGIVRQFAAEFQEKVGLL